MSEPKPVLVVVDVQNGFITEHSKPVIPIIVDLVRRWQAAHGDVVFSRYLNYAGSPFERLLG
jgi:nicotinamidase-related amidase